MPPASTEQFASVGEVELCYETFGADDAPPLLLVMGLGSQMIFWDDAFCTQLAAGGHRVIRFDNRDCGRSTVFDQTPPPTLRQLILRDKRAVAYPLEALADDAVGLLDHLGIERAPIVGVSMGGMIVQLMAIRQPQRISAMVSIMSSTGSRRVGNAQPQMLRRLLRPTPRDREGAIRSSVETFAAIGSRTYPPDRTALRALAERAFDRGHHPAGTARQLAAINTTADRTAQLRALSLPVTVIHGTEDRLIAPSGGKATAKAIPGAKLMLVRGMGHDLPPPLWPALVAAILRTVA
jgi:pimeloyl-ACP methyl ester carboxylesterase